MTEQRKKEFVDYAIENVDIEASGLNEVLTKEIIGLLQPLMVGLQLLKIDTLLVSGPGSTRTLRYKADLDDMEAFNESADIPNIGIGGDFYSHIDVKPSYIGGHETISGQAIIDADFDVIRDIQTSLAESHARAVDARIWAEILNVTALAVPEVTTAAGPTWEDQLAHANILQVVAVTTTNPVTWTVDYVNGYIQYSGDPGVVQTIDYVYTTRPVVSAGAVGVLSYEDIVMASTTISSKRGVPDKLVVDPIGFGDLLVDDKFTHASQLGDATITNGRIGMMCGLQVLLSHNMYPGVAFVCQSGFRLGYYVYKEMLKAKIEDIVLRPGDKYVSAWEKSLPKVTDGNMCVVILGGPQVNAYLHV